MFRPMRRAKQQLSEERCIEILKKGSNGVLAVAGDDGYPYAVPLSYAYQDGKLYFHGATTGHKLDAIRRQEKVSFCVIDQDVVLPKERSTLFRSVIAFGRARILETEEEIRESCLVLGRKYSGDYMDLVREEIDEKWKMTGCIEITIEHLTGKESWRLVKEEKG